MTNKDDAPSVARVAPIVNAANVTATYQGASTNPQQFQGTNVELFVIRDYKVASGTTFTQEDLDAHAKVAVVGLTVAKNLLGEDADASDLIGQSVKFGNSQLTVIGILKPKGANGTQDQDNIVLAPLTTVRELDRRRLEHDKPSRGASKEPQCHDDRAGRSHRNPPIAPPRATRTPSWC